MARRQVHSNGQRRRPHLLRHLNSPLTIHYPGTPHSVHLVCLGAIIGDQTGGSHVTLVVTRSCDKRMILGFLAIVVLMLVCGLVLLIRGEGWYRLPGAILVGASFKPSWTLGLVGVLGLGGSAYYVSR